MVQATWNGTVLADSNATIVIEGTHYFPPDSIVREHYRESAQTSVCGWKGTANYYDIVVGADTNASAAWYYADPKPEAARIKGYIAFWRGVEVG